MTNQNRTKSGQGRQRSDLGSVLIVDDHVTSRESMADILCHAGYQGRCCMCAVEALQTIANMAFDEIITDLEMPGMDGLEFLHKLRKNNDDTSVVLVAAFASIQSTVEAMRYGVFDYIEKPFDAEQLETVVSSALQRGDSSQAIQATPGKGSPVTMIGLSQAMKGLKTKIAQILVIDISTSLLVAQRTRLNAIFSNLENMSTILNEDGHVKPYQPRFVTFQSDESMQTKHGAMDVKVSGVHERQVEPIYKTPTESPSNH